MGRPKTQTPFIGRIQDSRFRIIRVVRGRDSFNPVLYGRFRPSSGGTRVKVLMTFHPIVWLFILGWSLYFGYAVFGDFRASGTISTGATVMLAAIWAIAVPIFYYDAARSRQLLEQCLHLHGVRFGG